MFSWRNILSTALYEMLFFNQKITDIFLISPQKHVVGTHLSTHNICFCGEIKKLSCGYPLLSRPMQSILSVENVYYQGL